MGTRRREVAEEFEASAAVEPVETWLRLKQEQGATSEEAATLLLLLVQQGDDHDDGDDGVSVKMKNSLLVLKVERLKEQGLATSSSTLRSNPRGILQSSAALDDRDQ